MRKYNSNERRMSAETADAVMSMFDVYNREFFGGTLPPVSFRYVLVKSGMQGGYRSGMIRLAVPLRMMRFSEHLRQVLFINGLETETARIVLHELVHHWQNVEKSETDGIMHNEVFKSKMSEMGINEIYSGRSLQFTRLKEINKGGAFDSLLHRKDFMDMCLAVKAGIVACLDNETKKICMRRTKLK